MGVATITRPMAIKETFSPFSGWLREQPELDSRRAGLDIQNLDYIVHGYLNSHYVEIMHIEEKTNAVRLPRGQQETLGFHAQAFMAMERHGLKLQTNRGDKYVRYKGFHVLVFEKDWFDGGWVTWDNQPITEDQLRNIVAFNAHEDCYLPFV